MTFPRRGAITQRIYNETHRQEPQEVKQPAPLPAACPRCGKQLGRGKYMHIKNCKG